MQDSRIGAAIMLAFEMVGDRFMPPTPARQNEAVQDIVDASMFVGASGSIRYDVTKAEFLRRAGEIWDDAVSHTRAVDAEVDS
jgi:hypothetical protein